MHQHLIKTHTKPVSGLNDLSCTRIDSLFYWIFLKSLSVWICYSSHCNVKLSFMSHIIIAQCCEVCNGHENELVQKILRANTVR